MIVVFIIGSLMMVLLYICFYMLITCWLQLKICLKLISC